MARIYNLLIKNFRGIKELEQQFNGNFICLIGKGDSGKSTILEAISCALSSNWAHPFFDNDFYNCNTAETIIIEVSLTDLPDDLIREDKFGLHLRGIDAGGNITDELDEIEETLLTVRLEVAKDLEPQWNVITKRENGNKVISASDRSKLNSFLVADSVDRHFSWGKGSPLYSLLRQGKNNDNEDTIMIDALRDAKSKIDGAFTKFDDVIRKVKANAAAFGIDIAMANTTIDFRDIVIKDGKVSLHDGSVPFRLKGKGSKRLISIAIQAAVAEAGGMVMIDEIEQGLESYRVQGMVNMLKRDNQGQIFITTHSRDVLIELAPEDIFLVRTGERSLVTFDASLQKALRKNPEAFFAKKVLVCEGATELGVCRALDEWRIKNGYKSATLLGVRSADGTGSEMINYCKGFHKTGFPIALFCDSDDDAIEKQKPDLAALGIAIVDWGNKDSFETAVTRHLSFGIVTKLFELAAQIKAEENTVVTIAQYKLNMWDAVKARFGAACPADLASLLIRRNYGKP